MAINAPQLARGKSKHNIINDNNIIFKKKCYKKTIKDLGLKKIF